MKLDTEHGNDSGMPRNLGANGIVGRGIPIAVGAALAQQPTGSGRVVVSYGSRTALA